MKALYGALEGALCHMADAPRISLGQSCYTLLARLGVSIGSRVQRMQEANHGAFGRLGASPFPPRSAAAEASSWSERPVALR